MSFETSSMPSDAYFSIEGCGIEFSIMITDEKDFELIGKIISEVKERQSVLQQLNRSQKDKLEGNVVTWNELKKELFSE